MADDVWFKSALSGLPHVVAVWTMLSFAVAAGWCIYRAPGRGQRQPRHARRSPLLRLSPPSITARRAGRASEPALAARVHGG